MLVDILTNLLSVEFGLLSSVSDANNLLTLVNLLWSTKSENQGVYAAELWPRAKPGYVHSLGCDPVKFSQELGTANLTLAFTQNQRLLASRPTPELTVTIPHTSTRKEGIWNFRPKGDGRSGP